MDIEIAYCLVPVHPQDHILQGMEWEEKVYVDSCWSTVSTKDIQCSGRCPVLVPPAMRVRYVLCYLDDYIVVAPPDLDECARAVRVLQHTCNRLGVPMAADKKEGPVTALIRLTCSTRLGIDPKETA